MSDEQILRIFGSFAAYRKALPEREWFKTDNGWASRAR
jgi:hypothetical protein